MKRVSFVLFAAALLAACGKKGPPLPPLIRVPAAPADLTAVRHGDTVEIEFAVPSANTDGTRPANVERVDLYAFAGADIRNEELLKLEPMVSVEVKAPRDPNRTIEEDEAAEDMEPPEGAGLDQGAKASVQEKLTAASAVRPVVATRRPSREPDAEERMAPLVGPPLTVPARTYVAVGVSTSGRRGPMSRRARIPLTPQPPPPPPPAITYNETAITVTWAPPAGFGRVQVPAGKGLLPAKPIGPRPPVLTYNVYDATRANSGASLDQAEGANPSARRLTKAPVSSLRYSDNRVVWGVERCYEVRTVATVEGLTVESDASPPVCTTLVDTFPPEAPRGLTAVPGEGSISLIWQPNDEKDLTGYLVFRGADSDKTEPVTPSPIQDTTFRDAVARLRRYSYVVKAIDEAGNQSAASDRVEETAR